MKSLFYSMIIVVAASGVAHAQSASNGEIGYAKGSLGYDALNSGDNEQAIKQILASEKVSRNDPARLINLGQAYARTGRTYEAKELFTAAMASRDEVDLILADGRVMSSKEAARQALLKLQARVASR
ncbi:MAG: tetratricopeptide repeat protein [Sphingorhabdus sp.]